MRIFLDANILFSAADRDSATRAVLDILLKKGREAVTSQYAFEEAERNLSLKRPRNLSGLLSLSSQLLIIRAISPSVRCDLNEDDLPIISSAKAGDCALLWTSDKRHFGQYYGLELCGVKIVSSVGIAKVLRV